MTIEKKMKKVNFKGLKSSQTKKALICVAAVYLFNFQEFNSTFWPDFFGKHELCFVLNMPIHNQLEKF